MQPSEWEVVRVEFSDADYDALRAYASEKGVTVEAAVRAALDAATGEQPEAAGDDAALAVLDDPGDESTR